MRSKSLRALIACSAVLFALQAHAQRIGFTRGAGLAGCGEYLNDRRVANNEAAYTHWTQGFMSSYNLYGTKSQAQDIPDPLTILAYLDRFCRDNPLERVVAGAVALMKDKGGMR